MVKAIALALHRANSPPLSRPLSRSAIRAETIYLEDIPTTDVL
jgi:hypothetical protein